MVTTISWAVTILTLVSAGAPPSSHTGAEHRAMVTMVKLSNTWTPVTRLTITGCLEHNVKKRNYI